MRHFDYSFLSALPLSSGLSSLLSTLRWQSSLLARQLKHASAREKRALTAKNIPSASPLPELSFPGYGQALEEILLLQDKAALDEEDFLHICRLLLPEDAALDTEKKQTLGLLLSACRTAKQEGADPLLLIPCVALDLICLSPAQTVSHGAALLLARLLLYRSGLDAYRFVMLEEKICRFYFYYDRALAQSAMHWAENSCDYLPYLEAFLSLLYLACTDVQAALPSPKLSKREQIELLVLGSPVPVSKAQISAALPEVSLTTIEAVLGAMVKAGSVQRLGLGRATHYLRA